MGKRVAAARHLGEVLTRTTPRAAPALPRTVVDTLAALKAEGFKAAMLSAVPGLPSADELQFVAAVKRTQQVLQLAKLGMRSPASKLSGERELPPRTTVVKKKTARKRPVAVTNPSTKKANREEDREEEVKD